MKVVMKKVLEAPAHDVWDVLGERFADIGSWAPFVAKSQLKGPLSVGSVRTCELRPSPAGSGTIREKITRFDRDQRALTYRIFEGLPGFMRLAENAWTVVPTSDGRSRVTSELTIKTAWWMAPMAPLIGRRFGGVINDFMVELEAAAIGSPDVVEPGVVAG